MANNDGIKRMQTKLVALYLLLIGTLAVGAVLTPDDKELARRLVGTWTTDPSEPGPMVSTATYKADGTGTELVRPRGEPGSAAVRVTTRWSITNGCFILPAPLQVTPRRYPLVSS